MFVSLDTSPDFASARFAESIVQRRSLDSMDGYQQTVTISLLDDDIGQYFVFVTTDFSRRVRIFNFFILLAFHKALQHIYARINKPYGNSLTLHHIMLSINHV